MNPSSLRWRESVVTRLANALASDSYKERRFAHAQEVEEQVKQLLQDPTCASFAEEERSGLRVAAFLHGVNDIRPSSKHCSEAITSILGQMEEFKDSTRLLKLVEDLVSDCEAAFPGFPTAIAEKSSRKPRTTHPDARTRELIDFLREADALAHLEDSYLEESIESWLNAGLPRVLNSGGCLATWVWMDTVVGNLRLTAKRGLLDARTPSGRARAREAYYRVEELVRTQCELANVSYEPEVCGPEMLEQSREKMSEGNFSLEIVEFHPWPRLEKLLRMVPLLHNADILPYEKANMLCSLQEIKSLAPLSSYIMKDRLEEVEELHHAFMVTFCFGLWDLPGLVMFKYNNKAEQVLAPPLVEVHEKAVARKNRELFTKGELDNVLIDGLHRAMAAEKNSLRRLRAVVISSVKYPPMAVAKDWGAAKVYEREDPPKYSDKRDYRYASLDEFSREPFVSHFHADKPVTEANYQYYLFRDLSSLGSKGRRTFDEFKERRAPRRSDSAGT